MSQHDTIDTIWQHQATCEECSDGEDFDECGRPASLILLCEPFGLLALCHRHRRYYADEFAEHPVAGVALAVITARQAPEHSPARVIARAVIKAKREYNRLRRDEEDVPLNECWAEFEALADLLSPSVTEAHAAGTGAS